MLVFFLTIILISGLAYGAYFLWQSRIERDLIEGAAAEYARLERADPELVEGMERGAFEAVYRMVEMPRFPGYAVAVIITFLLGTPVFLGLLSGGDVLMNKLGAIPAPSEVVTRIAVDDTGQTRVISDVPPEALQYYVEDLGGFYYFFGLLIFWVAIVVFFMRRYHGRTPGSLRDEIIRAR